MKQETFIDGLVSVIMPCYNATVNLEEAIESVLAQSYTNLELLIVDDASTEPIENIILKYRKDDRIRYLKHSMNQGVAVARNTGLLQSKGRYVAFLDSDDLWYSDKLEQQLFFMNANQVAFMYSAYEVVRDTSDNRINTIQVPQQINYNVLLKNTIIGCLTVLIDRKQTGFFEMPIISVGEDSATWLNLLKEGHVAYGIQKPLAKYRVAGQSLSSNKLKMVKGTWRMYRQTQNLSILKTGYYFSFYVINAILKRI
ncbi:glycosyltransferase family A protein [Bacillus cereus group sp. BfR-BA-01354]|uniref:glycosyltransferase family 2 protein n=1 Tax=Bacillus cereus group TaxID=86661 RepID=UPI001F5A03B7